MKKLVILSIKTNGKDKKLIDLLTYQMNVFNDQTGQV